MTQQWKGHVMRYSSVYKTHGYPSPFWITDPDLCKNFQFTVSRLIVIQFELVIHQTVGTVKGYKNKLQLT